MLATQDTHPHEQAVVLNIAVYHFARVSDTAALATRLRVAAETSALRGTVLIAEEGINVFLAGPEAAIDNWLQLLQGEPGFEQLSVKRSYSRDVPFARLKVKVKKEIIAFRREQASPLLGRAPGVSPTDLARWMAQGSDDNGRRLLLLDTRNREEYALGTFDAAMTLPIDNFCQFPDAIETHRQQFHGATVVGFCTGGIRCEKAVRWLQHAGIDHALQLEGGILAYFEQVGDFGYNGSCFVFDQRTALDASLRPINETA